jgi:hypothetical protein
VKRDTAVWDELRKIAKKNGGLLRPDHVVRAAMDETSPLHSQFTWDDAKAAHEYRVWQARELIATYWVVEPGSNERVRLLLSLASDRPTKKGYRFSASVLANPEQRREWLLMALAELESWQKAYAALTELRPVFAAITRVLKRYGKEQEEKAA